MSTIEFTDRYGGRVPSWLRGCHGKCEAMGCVPIHADRREEPWRALWLAAEAKAPSDDGYHFVTCPECNGTGRVPWYVSIARVPRWLWGGVRSWRSFPDPEMGSWWKNFKLKAWCIWGADLARLRN